MRAATFALVTLLALHAFAACAPPAAAPAPAQSSLSSVASSAASTSDASVLSPPPTLLSLDALAARASALAPGMREVARGDASADSTSAQPRLLVRADAADLCVRVAFVAQSPLHAWLTDARGDVLADGVSISDAALGAHGPVCVKKGDAVSLRIEPTAMPDAGAAPASAPCAARFVAWASP